VWVLYGNDGFHIFQNFLTLLCKSTLLVIFAGLWRCEKHIMKVVVLTIYGCLFLSVSLCVIVLVVLFQVWIHRVSSVSSQTPCSVAAKLQLPFMRISVCVRDKGWDPEVVVLECSLLTRLCFYSRCGFFWLSLGVSKLRDGWWNLF
jgi:hypothetical protein